MKSFKQYIDEAYNFRLGGSQQKGFNQGTMISQLQPGDIIYVYANWWTKDKCRKLVFKKFEKDGNQYNLGYKYKDDRYTHHIFNVFENLEEAETSCLKQVRRCQGRKDMQKRVFATDLDGFIEAVREVSGEYIIKKDIVDYTAGLTESYSFRLGGSQKKGFDQTKHKKLSELEEGDTIFVCRKYGSSKFCRKYTFVKFSSNGTKCHISILDTEKANVYVIYEAFDDMKEANTSCLEKEVLDYGGVKKTVIATNEEEFIYSVKKFIGDTITLKDIEDHTINESYSFRLGGSQKKGFDQTKKKTFAELEKGDNLYRCHIDYDKLKEAEICTFNEITREGGIIEIHYKRGVNEYVDNYMKLGKDELDGTISIIRFNHLHHSSIHVISTNEEDLFSKIYELIKEKDPKLLDNTVKS